MANQNVTQLTQQTVSAAGSSLFYAVVGGATDTGLPLSVLFNNPAFTGVPTTSTAAVDTNTTQIASTAYVINQGYLKSTTAASTYAPLASPTFTGTVVIPTVTLSGGTINNTPIGATTASTGQFTTLGTTGLATFNSLSTANATITGGTINSTPIGATTASSGRFTTVVATSTITPSTTSGIVGTTLADNASAGSVGEYISNTATGITPTSGVSINVTSINLTAGDWDVWGTVQYSQVSGAVTFSQLINGISTTTGTLPAGIGSQSILGLTFTANFSQSMVAPMQRINVSTTTTVYLVAQATFTNTAGMAGFIAARRRR